MDKAVKDYVIKSHVFYKQYKSNFLFAYIQVQNLALRHLPGALATAHSVVLKPSAQSKALTQAASISKTSVCSVKSDQLTDASTERGVTDVIRLASGPPIITPGELICTNPEV